MNKYDRSIHATESGLKPLRSKHIATNTTEVPNQLVIAVGSAQQEEELRNSIYTGESETQETVKLRVTTQTSTKPSSMEKMLRVYKRRRFTYLRKMRSWLDVKIIACKKA